MECVGSVPLCQYIVSHFTNSATVPCVLINERTAPLFKTSFHLQESLSDIHICVKVKDEDQKTGKVGRQCERQSLKRGPSCLLVVPWVKNKNPERKKGRKKAKTNKDTD